MPSFSADPLLTLLLASGFCVCALICVAAVAQALSRQITHPAAAGLVEGVWNASVLTAGAVALSLFGVILAREWIR